MYNIKTFFATNEKWGVALTEAERDLLSWLHSNKIELVSMTSHFIKEEKYTYIISIAYK